jgi:hypothetical protein
VNNIPKFTPWVGPEKVSLVVQCFRLCAYLDADNAVDRFKLALSFGAGEALVLKTVTANFMQSNWDEMKRRPDFAKLNPELASFMEFTKTK